MRIVAGIDYRPDHRGGDVWAAEFACEVEEEAWRATGGHQRPRGRGACRSTPGPAVAAGREISPDRAREHRDDQPVAAGNFGECRAELVDRARSLPRAARLPLHRDTHPY